MTGDDIPLKPSDLIFPILSNNLSTTLTSLKRSNLSITNRLHSIKHDSDFVLKVAHAYQLPLIANERCGSWYIPPSEKAGSAYFKSTDGHFGQWGFSLRRLNLQVLDVVQRTGGCVIVDSTRRGKSMPDALSKTIPIWIVVLNRLLFPDDTDSHVLKTPQHVVSRSEHDQIGQRLALFVEQIRSLDVDVDHLRSRLNNKPLEPVWVTPDSKQSDIPLQNADRNVVVLCTASGRSISSVHKPPNYVQGAADDSESWARGLKAESFWANCETLLKSSEDDLPALIDSIMIQSIDSVPVRAPVLVKPSKNVFIASNAAVASEFDVVISCSPIPCELLVSRLQHRYIHLVCATGKVGSRQLRAELPKLYRLVDMRPPPCRILVTCANGKDLAVGVALAISCCLIDDEGTLHLPSAALDHTKASIKKRLSWIMVSMPDAAPSRATLQSVNSFLLG